MKIYSAAEVAEKLPYRALIPALREAFSQRDIETPLRSMYKIYLPSGAKATLGVMPAWRAGEIFAIKLLADGAGVGVDGGF